MKAQLMQQQIASACHRGGTSTNPLYVAEQLKYEQSLRERDALRTAFDDAMAATRKRVMDKFQKLTERQLKANDEAEMEQKHMVYVAGRLRDRQRLVASRF